MKTELILDRLEEISQILRKQQEISFDKERYRKDLLDVAAVHRMIRDHTYPAKQAVALLTSSLSDVVARKRASILSGEIG